MAENGAMRTETFPVGIVGVGLAEETRQVPAGEPPPLPPNAELAVIGKPYPRANGRAKVTGAIRFTVDVALPGHAVRPHPPVAPCACRGARHRHGCSRARSAGARDRPRGRPRRSGAFGRSLCRPARRRHRGDLDGRGGRGAASRPRRLQAASLRRRSRRGAPAGSRQKSTTREPRPGVRRANSSRRPACRSTATCAGRLKRAAATSRKVSPPRTSWSRASTARRSRRIAAWSRTASSPIGAPTA